jgi:multisubunit Na+/H+ antiporter MnhC subunit
MTTDKKVTHVGGNESQNTSTSGNRPDFTPTKEAKGRATQMRLIAGILWALAIGAQIWAINLLFKQPVVMWLIITLIVVDLALVIVGSLLWKKSNRLDPASEKNKLLFFMQSQLGLFAAIIAFLPLVIFILTNKNIDKKQKAILGSIAGVALVIAGITGYDFNPPSVEEYTQQTHQVEDLTQGQNLVYWTKSGTKYHLSDSCSYINTDKTDEIFSGTVAQARELKKITELCSLCQSRAEKANVAIPEAAEEIVEANE